MCHCTINVCKKCKYLHGFLFQQFVCRSALEKLKGDWPDTGHRQNEDEYPKHMPAYCGFFELTSLQAGCNFGNCAVNGGKKLLKIVSCAVWVVLEYGSITGMGEEDQGFTGDL